MAQVDTHRPLTAEGGIDPRSVRVRLYGRSGTGTCFFSHYFRVPPVSIIPPMFYSHSFIYNGSCIMFFSQHFSFPCQYHSTNAPYSFIHLPPTLHDVFLPALQFPLSVPFHQCSIHIHSTTTNAV